MRKSQHFWPKIHNGRCFTHLFWAICQFFAIFYSNWPKGWFFCVNLWQFYPRPNFFIQTLLVTLVKNSTLVFCETGSPPRSERGSRNWLVLIVSWLSLADDADDGVGDDFVFGPLDPRLIIIWSSLRVTLIFILTPGITSWHLSYRSWSNIFCLDDHSPSFEMMAQYVLCILPLINSDHKDVLNVQNLVPIQEKNSLGKVPWIEKESGKALVFQRKYCQLERYSRYSNGKNI